MPFDVHPGFLIILLVIVLVLFGPGRLPEVGGAVGRALRQLRSESQEEDGESRGEGR